MIKKKVGINFLKIEDMGSYNIYIAFIVSSSLLYTLYQEKEGIWIFGEKAV